VTYMLLASRSICTWDGTFATGIQASEVLPVSSKAQPALKSYRVRDMVAVVEKVMLRRHSEQTNHSGNCHVMAQMP